MIMSSSVGRKLSIQFHDGDTADSKATDTNLNQKRLLDFSKVFQTIKFPEKFKLFLMHGNDTN